MEYPDQSIIHLGHKDVKFSVQQSKVSKTKCKICHDEDSIESPLKIFCNCKEKRFKMHKDCLKAYLEERASKLISIDSNWEAALICENCQEPYQIQHSTSRTCPDIQTILKNIKRRSFLFGLCIIGLVISIILLAFCSHQLAIPLEKNSIDNQSRTILMISLIILATFIFLISFFKLMLNFILRLKVQVRQ